ncbi:MAG: hypothetical protein U9Q85_01245 [Patescibacteria group bacterium]|nr:hypothetical protein [Patescibacteria group bacterium]
MLWINFLHLYQPVHTDAYFIKEATEKSYKRIISALEAHPEIGFTLNINTCLFLRWEELGYSGLIKRIAVLLERGQIELTGNAAYHPLLPLIPKEELERQIKESEDIFRKHFGEKYKPRGFFMSEMAYGKEAAKAIKELGYEWIILDEITYNGRLKQVDFRKCHIDKESKLKLIFRSRKLSSDYVPKLINKLLDKANGKIVAITATDAELYGLRYNDIHNELGKLFKDERLETKLISDYLDLACTSKAGKEINLVSSNWESTERELKEKRAYSSWKDNKKDIHKKLWQLTNHVYTTVCEHQDDDNYYWARWHLVRGLSSCTFWWASGKDFRYIFGPYAWNPDEIERGTNELVRSIRAINNELTIADKIKAEHLFVEIKKIVWEKHWIYYWKKVIN